MLCQPKLACSSILRRISMKMNSFSSSYGQLTLHMCFVVKYRHKVFANERVSKFCEHVIRQTAQRYSIHIKEIGFDTDHVHLLVSVNPSISPAKIAHLLKGASAFKLFRAFPWLKTKLWGGHFWSPAYFFDSVGDNTFERLENYVRNQGS